MKKILTILFAVIIGLSIFGAFDNAKRKKEAAEREKMTSVFFAEVESKEKVGDETKFVFKALEESPKEFRGKTYEYTTNKDFQPINKDGSAATVDLFKEKDEVAIRHIGKIEEKETNVLTGEVTMSPFVNPVKNPPKVTGDKARAFEDSTEGGNTNPDKGGKKPTETGSKE